MLHLGKELSQGYTTFKTKNLVKTISSAGNSALIEYNFDGDGKISSLLFTGSNTSLIEFTYEGD